MEYKSLHGRIIELGDDAVRFGRKVIDPHLCCYNGSYFMFNSNENLKKDVTVNGTQGRLAQIKLKGNPQSYRWEIWDSKNVWTVCASDVEYVDFEYHPKTHEI